MGRQKIYKTDEQRKLANREKSKRYYEKHGQSVRIKRMQRYWESRRGSLERYS